VELAVQVVHKQLVKVAAQDLIAMVVVATVVLLNRVQVVAAV
jgi:hypothetical protein